MASRGESIGARPVTRASSRASSRAPSEEAPSVTGDAGPSARQARRDAREKLATPSKPTKVTNKASKSYGAKGRSQGPAAAAGNQSAHDAIASAIPEDEPTNLPTDGEAGELPVLTEEGESTISGAQASSRGHQQTQGTTHSQAGAPAQSGFEAHDITQDIHNAQLQGASNNQAESSANAQARSATAGQTQANAENIAPIEEVTSWYHFTWWTPREQAADPGVREREQAGNPEAERGFWNNFPDREGGLLRFPQGSIFKAIIGAIVVAFFAFAFVPVGHYASTAFPTTQTAQSTDLLHGRVGNLEKIVNRLNSISPFPKVTPTVHQVNWFAAGNGAVVDPYLSSPVDLICENKDTSWVAWFMNVGRLCTPSSRMHGQVLRPWSEPDDRFCAPPGRGKLQLSVLTSRPVAPTELVIEHMPKDASIYIGDAPKEIELWVHIDDGEVRDKVLEYVHNMFPGWLDPSSPQKDRELAPGQALTAEYVLVGRWTYNIWENENIQSFTIPFPLKTLGVASTKFAFRVNSNWGDYAATCIYRLRMHGKDASGIVEDLEIDPRLV